MTESMYAKASKHSEPTPSFPAIPRLAICASFRVVSYDFPLAMKTRRNPGSATPSGDVPPLPPCLLHRIPNETLKQIVTTSVDLLDLPPIQHQKRTFELGSKVCKLWHDLLSRPEAYVATDASMAKRLAERIRSGGSGGSVRKLGVGYVDNVHTNGFYLAKVAIPELVRECPRLRELILIGNYELIAPELESCFPLLPLLQRLELDVSGDSASYVREKPLPKSFLSILTSCPSLLHLDTGRFMAPADTTPLPAGTVSRLTHFETTLRVSNNMDYLASIMKASSSTLTSLRLGHFWASDHDVTVVLDAITPLTPHLKTFGWHPSPKGSPWTEDRSITTLARFSHLRFVEIGSSHLDRMFSSNVLRGQTNITDLTIIVSSNWKYKDSHLRFVTFLGSEHSQGLDRFSGFFHSQAQSICGPRLRLCSGGRYWKLEAGSSNGIEVVL
ncbi:hypothetical protein P7C70_g1378, partial [Phenoliferia sp. Uapishka_3]